VMEIHVKMYSLPIYSVISGYKLRFYHLHLLFLYRRSDVTN